jgi:hypothetical protein
LIASFNVARERLLSDVMGAAKLVSLRYRRGLKTQFRRDAERLDADVAALGAARLPMI